MTSFWIRNVRIFDGFDVHAKLGSVLTVDSQIEYVGTTDPSHIPEVAVEIDGEGCTLLPGLIDAHTHVFRAPKELKAAITAGVTTVFDMHNVPANALYMKNLAQTSSELPEIFSALHAATIDGGWPRAIVRHTNTDPTVSLLFSECRNLSRHSLWLRSWHRWRTTQN